MIRSRTHSFAPTKFLLVLFALTAAAGAHAQEEGSLRHVAYPLLPYVFYDSGSTSVPARYTLLSPARAVMPMGDTVEAAGVLEAHHVMLNVIGRRMRMYPKTTIEVRGVSSDQPELNENDSVANLRAWVVRSYLSSVWEIEPGRIRISKTPAYPQSRSSLNYPLGIVEKRRVEIVSDDWEIVRPVIPEPDVEGGRVDTLRFELILFKFDSPEAGPLNERVLKEYVYPVVTPGAHVIVTGFTDIVGLDDRNSKLSLHRAQTVVKHIQKNVPPKTFTIESRGAGELEPQYTNALPEGRFHNRMVRIDIVLPKKESSVRP